MLYKVQVPSSLFLLGEHAVLHKEPAIVCAVDKKITVELIPRSTDSIKISSMLGDITLSLDAIKKLELEDIKNIHHAQFVIVAIKCFIEELTSGFELKIHSEIESTIGFGTSAAVTAATVAVLNLFINEREAKPIEIFNLCKEIILTVQDGIGSCADLAASLYGGVILYNMQPLTITKLNMELDLVAIYSGYKTKTVDVIQEVNKNCKNTPYLFSGLYKLMGDCVVEAKNAIDSNNVVMLGKIMNIYHGLLVSLGVSDNNLDTIVHELRKTPHVCGAKISGSGLGDCIIALTNGNYIDHENNKNDKTKVFPISISNTGLIYDNK